MALLVAYLYPSIFWCSDDHPFCTASQILICSTILAYAVFPSFSVKISLLPERQSKYKYCLEVLLLLNIPIIVLGFIVAVAVTFAIDIIIRCIGENYIHRNRVGVWVNNGPIVIHGNSRISSCFFLIFDIVSVDSFFNTTLILLLFQSFIAPRFWPRFFSDQSVWWSCYYHLFERGIGSYIGFLVVLHLNVNVFLFPFS